MLNRYPGSILTSPVASVDLIQSAKSERFSSCILNVARQLIAVDEICSLKINAEGNIVNIFGYGECYGVGERVDKYRNVFFHLDPVIKKQQKFKKKTSFIQILNAAEITNKEYRETCYSKPGFSNRISIGWHDECSTTILNLYRANLFGKVESINHAKALSQILMPALLIHNSNPMKKQRENHPPEQLLQYRLEKNFIRLTERERQVIALTLLGYNSGGISDVLGICQSTVLTYRLRAYQRYNFTNASDFLASLLY